MDQFDKAIEETQEANPNEGPASILIIGDALGSNDIIRASLEVGGHRVTQVPTIASFEEAVIQNEYDLIISLSVGSICGEWYNEHRRPKQGFANFSWV